MHLTQISRRFFCLGALSLAGCQTTTADNEPVAVSTTDYDGEYTLIFGRFWNPTPNNLADPNYRTDVEELAFVTAAVHNGVFTVNRVDDSSVGSNYLDFKAGFNSSGTLNLSTTVGYLKGKPRPYKIRVSAAVGDQLRDGQNVSLRPKGYSANYSAHLSIKKTR